jgi:transposase-like protein
MLDVSTGACVWVARQGGLLLNLESEYFRDEDAARRKLESLRWPDGVVCCHCGSVGTARKIASDPGSRIRAGLYRCSRCRRQFTVTVGTIFESSHIPLHKWLQAVHLLFAAVRPVRVKVIERTLDVTYKSAWMMVQRLRTAERPGRAAGPLVGLPVFPGQLQESMKPLFPSGEVEG